MRPGPTPSLSRYLVEWYLPGLTGELLDQTAERIDRTAGELSAEGTEVDLLLTVFVPADEVAFCLFAAGSRQAVMAACQRAELPLDRIAEAIEKAAVRPPAGLVRTTTESRTT